MFKKRSKEIDSTFRNNKRAIVSTTYIIYEIRKGA
jgi:hypothetical protein